jgi:hypothetical protein
MGARLEIVVERIRALLANERGRPSRERMEWTLTEGYAEALALDGERLRIERRIDDVTAQIARGRAQADELRELIERQEDVQHELAQLRELLASLRVRAARAA